MASETSSTSGGTATESRSKSKPKVLTEAQAREADGRKKGDKVKIALAHPISREQDKRYLGLDVNGTYEVGDTVEVSVNGAQALIGAGLAQVDTEDPEAVAKALGGE